MAPACERALPLSCAASNKLIAPLANIVPTKVEPAPKSTCPFTCQKTLHAEVEIRLILESVVVDKAPSIKKINSPFGSPDASNIKFPFNVEAAPRQ